MDKVNDEKAIEELVMMGVDADILEKKISDIVMKDLGMIAAIDVAANPDNYPKHVVDKMPPTLMMVGIMLSAIKVSPQELTRKLLCKALVISSLQEGDDQMLKVYNDLEYWSEKIKTEISKSVK